MASSTSSCDSTAVTFTLLGALLTAGPAAWPACVGGGRAFLRDYAQRGTNALLWAVLLAVTWVLLLRVAALLRLWALGSRIPAPRVLLADPGLADVLRTGGDITGFLSKLHSSYGPVVRLWVGPSQLLVSVKDPTLVKEVLTKAEDKLPLTGRTYNLACGRLSLFVSSFEKVKSTRESLKIFLNEKLTIGGNLNSFKVIDAIMYRSDSIMSKDFLDSRSFSRHMAFNIIGAILFGDAFLDWSDTVTYEELLMMVAKDGCFWASYAVCPFWKPSYRRYQTLCAKLKILTESIIRKSRDQNSSVHHFDQRSYQKSEGMMAGHSLLGAAEGLLSSEEEICGNIMGLMLHSISTSANLIGNILTRLIVFPKLQDQLHAEIVAACNESSELEVDDVLRMQFLLATVCESARLLPAGPLLQRCSLKHDLTLGSGITVPAGAILFNPHRFLKKDIDLGDILAAPSGSNGMNLSTDCAKTESFLPFGSGSRACVGQKFVILAISMLIASLLRKYEVQPHPSLSKEVGSKVDSSHFHHLPNSKIILTKRRI
ncbi:cytochrome P450 3A29-like [Panicum miliaceum]|uniref:Cytochrome P450 3A29-like n=1 Tax=Panicum miliaceum TaxID=4540 RepID=A0A3L6QQG3_PANMI|nr:cytochrome P450 3A29-like [Panicum miliaceum]